MDDRDIVAAMKASALATMAGLAAAYDKYATSLYSYCCWLVGDTEAAAAVVLETFRLALTDLRGIRNPDLLRSHLYAVARDECRQRQQADSPADQDRPLADHGRADLRGVINTTLAELDRGEREVVELVFRHGLSQAGLGLVLGIPQRRAATQAAKITGYLQERLAAPILAYTGAQTCPELGELLPDWDGRLTLWVTGLVQNHIAQCPTCKSLRYQAFQPAIVFALESSTNLPPSLRGQVIALCLDSMGAEAGGGRAETAPPSARQARLGTMLAFAAIAIWVIAAVSITLLTVA